MKLFYCLTLFARVGQAHSVPRAVSNGMDVESGSTGIISRSGPVVVSVAERAKRLGEANCMSEKDPYSSYTFDCILAKAYSREPAECVTNPAATKCILNYMAAFCGDLVYSRKLTKNPVPAAEKGNAIEDCLRKISLGPCVANPTGMACKSDLFAGIKYPVDPHGPSSSKRAEPSEVRDMLPQEKEKSHHSAFVDFCIGFAKENFNSLSAMLTPFASNAAHEFAIWCVALAGGLPGKPGEFFRTGCLDLFAATDPDRVKAPQFEYTNKAQKAGAIASEVVNTLLIIADGVAIARLMSPRAWMALKNMFAAPEEVKAIVGDAELVGFTIKGRGPHGEVNVAKLGPKGEALPFASKEDARLALDQAMDKAFVGCAENLLVRFKPPHKKLMPRLEEFEVICPEADIGIVMDDLAPYDRNDYHAHSSKGPEGYNPGEAYELHPSDLEDEEEEPIWYENDDDLSLLTLEKTGGKPFTPRPDPRPRTKAEMLNMPVGYFKDEVKLGVYTTEQSDIVELNNMHETWLRFARNPDAVSLPTFSEEAEPWVRQMYSSRNPPPDLANIRIAFDDHFGITPLEQKALLAWFQREEIYPLALETATNKMPTYEGWVQRRVRMSKKLVKMMTEGLPSRGVNNRGVYDVHDLVINHAAIDWTSWSDEDYRYLLTAHPGIGPFYDLDTVRTTTHLWVIRSRFGKYIAPAVYNHDQISFLDGVNGRFKLLGWAEKADGTPATFYFDNIPNGPDVP